jgi:pimeloyl-ACP methyl ester carboxylesterase
VNVIERAGRGPAVVCIHGFCQSSAYWVPTLDRLAAQGVGALAPDLPGFAGSSKEPGPYSMPALADAVAALLERRGLKRVILVGGSMGGVVAQHLALRHPQAVSRLLLVATGAFTADPAGALAKADLMAAAPWNEETVTPIVAGFFYKVPPAEKVAAYRAIAMQASQPAAVEAARSNASLRTFEELGRIAVPTLIIQGRHDKARTPEHGAEMQKRIVDARLEVIEDAGHTPQLEQPDRFHELALSFLLAH